MLALIAQAATENHAIAQEGGLAALGFDWKTLAFQVVNFGILLFVLRLVAYKPILRVLETRRQKIEDSLKASTEIEAIKKSLHEERTQVLKEAKTEIEQLISQSRKQAETIVKSAQQKAEDQGKQLVEKARAQATQELRGLQEQFKKQAVSLVVLATEQVIRQKLDPHTNEQLIEQALVKAEKEISLS